MFHHQTEKEMLKIVVTMSPNLEFYKAELKYKSAVYKTSNNYDIPTALGELNEIFRKANHQPLWDYEVTILHSF